MTTRLPAVPTSDVARTAQRIARILTAVSAVSALVLHGCAGRARRGSHTRAGPIETAPAALVGEFVDDYGNRFRITATEWRQLPRGLLHVRRWKPDAHYLIARNDSAGRYAPGRWTRIDWVVLTGMPPYEWAFCLSAYEAPTFAAAESTTVARPETPRTGCNGYPFSRMRRVAPASSAP